MENCRCLITNRLLTKLRGLIRILLNELHRLNIWQRRRIEAFKSWASENSVKLNPSNESCFYIEKLAFLDKLLAGKRIVFLGEEDHWVHEKYLYRKLLLRFLFSRGWRFVGEELGWSDGLRINRYLQTGAKIYLDQVVTYGYQGAMREDRDDKPSGILHDAEKNYPQKSFAAEQCRLAVLMRQFNEDLSSESKRLHFFGFDLDIPPGGGYEDLMTYLKPILNTPDGLKIKELLAHTPGETVEQEMIRLDQVVKTIDAQRNRLEELLGEETYVSFRQSALSLHDSMNFIRVAYPTTDWNTLNMVMASREEAMYRHVEFVLSKMKPEDKLVLMGHNRHLSKDTDSIKKMGAAPPGGKRVPSVGTYINHLLPGQVFSIWMLHELGFSSQPYSNLSSEYTSSPGSLNSLLGEIGECFMLPTTVDDPRSRLLTYSTDVVGIYNVMFKTALAKQTDAIFFVRKVSPLKLRVV